MGGAEQIFVLLTFYVLLLAPESVAAANEGLQLTPWGIHVHVHA